MHSDLSTSRQANPCLTTLLNICRKPHGTIGTKFAYRHLQVNQSWALGVRHHNSSVNYHCLWSDILQTASNENSRLICVRLKCLTFPPSQLLGIFTCMYYHGKVSHFQRFHPPNTNNYLLQLTEVFAFPLPLYPLACRPMLTPIILIMNKYHGYIIPYTFIILYFCSI